MPGRTNLNIRVPSALHAQLRARAKKKGVSITALCTDIFEHEAAQRAHSESVETFYPQIEKIIDVKLKAFADRIAKILVSATLDIGTLRNFQARIAKEVHELPSSEVNRMMSSSYNSTLAVLRNRASDQEEILAAIDDTDYELRELLERILATGKR